MYDEEEVRCSTCDRGINPYDERVHIWNVFNEEHPSGHQIFLCTECHEKRKYNVSYRYTEDNNA